MYRYKNAKNLTIVYITLKFYDEFYSKISFEKEANLHLKSKLAYKLVKKLSNLMIIY